MEEQQAAMAERRVASAETPATSSEEAERKRRVEALEMQRERVLSEQTSNPHRRSALQLALATIERDLEQLGWSVKL